MSKVKMTISLPQNTALYLREKPNASAVVAESVEIYRARELERDLEAAYRADASEAESLNREWQGADAKVED